MITQEKFDEIVEAVISEIINSKHHAIDGCDICQYTQLISNNTQLEKIVIPAVLEAALIRSDKLQIVLAIILKLGINIANTEKMEDVFTS